MKSGTRSESYTVSYQASVIYAQGEAVVWSSTKANNKLQKGQMQFPFQFALPGNCAPSFEGCYGFIRYQVIVEIDRVWKFNKANRRFFTVAPTFDLNSMPQAIQPIMSSNTKNTGMMLFRNGKVTVEARLPKQGFVPGESVVVDLHIDNQSSKCIKMCELRIHQLSRYFASQSGWNAFYSQDICAAASMHCVHQRVEDKKLINYEKVVDLPPKTKSTVQLVVTIPPCVASFNICPIITVDYFMEVKISTKGSINNTIHCDAPILIGTIPLRMAQVIVPTAPPQQQLYPMATGPSAPAMGSGAVVAAGAEGPARAPAPPVPAGASAGGSEQPPAYTGPPAGMELPPPSYEESIYGVAGTTQDTQNAMAFAPRYPYYHNLPPVPPIGWNEQPPPVKYIFLPVLPLRFTHYPPYNLAGKTASTVCILLTKTKNLHRHCKCSPVLFNSVSVYGSSLTLIEVKVQLKFPANDMSMLQLPEELIAQMASHLNYSDACNFMESSKRNCNIVKNFKIKMDKIQLDHLKFNMHKSYKAFVNEKKYNLKDLDLGEVPSAVFKNILEKCSFVGCLSFKQTTLTNSVIREIMKSETQFGTLDSTFGPLYISASDFVSFCRKFTSIQFHNINANRAIWRDEVFCALIPYVQLRISARKEVIECAEQITDRTLLALVGENCVQRECLLGMIHNSFTIPGIINLIKISQKYITEYLVWNLGILGANQAPDAKRYFEEDIDEVSALYTISVDDSRWNQTLYKLTAHQPFVAHNGLVAYSTITFAVEQPNDS